MRPRTIIRAGLALAVVLAVAAGVVHTTLGPGAWPVLGAGESAGAPTPAPAEERDQAEAPPPEPWRPAPLAFRAVSLAAPSGGRPASGAPTFADVDGDGAPDLFVAGERGGTCELHLARAGGPVAAAPRLLGLPESARYRAGTFADFDDDGDRDLYLTGADGTPDELLRQLPDGRFERATAEYELESPVPGRTRTALWTDLDGDGRLDLYRVRDAAPDSFARREPGATFVESAIAAGLSGGLDAESVLVADLDGDLDLDVLHSRGDAALGDRFLSNRGDGTFVELPALPGLERAGASTCAAQGDVDGDGLPDLFLASTSGEAQLWLARADEQGLIGYSAFKGAEGEPPPLELAGRRLESARFRDLDLDGALDLVAIGPRGLELHRGLGDGRFTDASAASGLSGFGAGGGRAFALGDPDLDGDLDIAVAGGGDGVLLLENQARGASWLRVCAPGRAGNGDGFGARVRIVLPDGRALVRTVPDGRDEPALSVGLGAAPSALEVRVEWSDGASARMHGIPAGIEVTLPPSAELVASHPAALLGEVSSFELEPALARAAEGLGAKLPPVDADEATARAEALDLWVATRPGPPPDEAARGRALQRIAAESRLQLAARALVQRLRAPSERVDARAAARRPEWDLPARVVGDALWFEDLASAERARAEGGLDGAAAGPHPFVLGAPTWTRLSLSEPTPFEGRSLPEPGAVTRPFQRVEGSGLLRAEQVLPPAPFAPRAARDRAEADLLRELAAWEVDRLLGLRAGATAREQP